MSVHTAVGLVVVLAGAFALRPNRAPASWYAHSGAGEARRPQPDGAGARAPLRRRRAGAGGHLPGLLRRALRPVAHVVVAVAAMIQALIFRAVGAVREHESDPGRARAREAQRTCERFTIAHRARRPSGSSNPTRAGKPHLREQALARAHRPDGGRRRWPGASAIHPDDQRAGSSPQWRAAADRRRRLGCRVPLTCARTATCAGWPATRAPSTTRPAPSPASWARCWTSPTGDSRRSAPASWSDRIAEAVSIIGPGRAPTCT